MHTCDTKVREECSRPVEPKQMGDFNVIPPVSNGRARPLNASAGGCLYKKRKNINKHEEYATGRSGKECHPNGRCCREVVVVIVVQKSYTSKNGRTSC